MKSALLTSQVLEGVCRLPGIATLDWCDRAASALCKLAPGAAAASALGRIDSKGFLITVEVSGASSGEGSTGLDLNRIRDSFKEGEWIGWSFTIPGDGGPFIALASQMGLLQRGEGPVGKRWAEFEPAEVLLAAAVLPGTPGRVILAEVALPNANGGTATEQAVLSAVMPGIQKRALSALGQQPIEKTRWLTPREELILWHLVAGKKVPQIAAELHRSVYTVHDHVKSLHRKLGASNRGQLVARALGHLGPLGGGELNGNEDSGKNGGKRPSRPAPAR